MIAFLEAKKAGLFSKKYFLKNLIAGLIVSVIALPLGMAFAIASGAKPEQGLYTAIIAGFFVSVFGGSRVQIAGPTGAFIVLLSSINAQYGMAGLQVATLMGGVILICMGVAKLGSVIKFIPLPVITGFTAGIGVIIWVGQWQYFFGLPKTGGEHFHEKFWALLQVFPQMHLATLFLAIISLITIIIIPKIKVVNKVPSPLTAMILATVLQSIFAFEGVATIGSTFGGIPQTLPEFSLPHINVNICLQLLGPAFTIAMLGAIESLLSAVVADSMIGTKHGSNQELIGQGIANIFTPLFAGISATGAIARTATNIKNGGNSPLAGIFHSIFLVLIILFIAPLATNIPLAAMAAILFVVSYNMSDIKRCIYMINQAPRADVVIFFVTFLLTILTDLVLAVNVGVILAIFHFMKRMKKSLVVYQFCAKELSYEPYIKNLGKMPDGLIVFSLEGPLFFGDIENFEKVLSYTHTKLKVIIIRFHHVPFVDMTAIDALTVAINKLQEKNIRIIITEANEEVYQSLHKAGIFVLTGKRMYWQNFSYALKSCEKILSGQDHTPTHKVEYQDGKVVKHNDKST